MNIDCSDVNIDWSFESWLLQNNDHENSYESL
jgi:hypothetical protein